jgi:hypothetical protein
MAQAPDPANKGASRPDLVSRADSMEIGRRRRGRNWAVFGSLAAMCALFYAIAMIKLSHH